MSLTKEDLNQIRLLTKDELKPISADLNNLREEFKVKFSILHDDIEVFKEKTEAQLQIHYKLLVDIKTEINGIYKYLNNDFTFADSQNTKFKNQANLTKKPRDARQR